MSDEYLEAAMDVAQERATMSTESPKEYREAFSRAKKRRKTLKRKFASLDPRDVSPSAEENSMSFPVRSSRDKTKFYTVRLNNGLRFTCNCGDQYGVPTRNNCRHVGTVITTMLAKYVNSHFKKPAPKTDSMKEMNVTQLEDMFSNFLQISSRR